MSRVAVEETRGKRLENQRQEVWGRDILMDRWGWEKV